MNKRSHSKPRSIEELSTGRAGRLPLVGGCLALDFTNTASGRGTPSRQDHLNAYNDLLAWAHHAGALDSRTALALAELAARSPTAASRALVEAARLRETLFVVFSALAHRSPPPTADLDTLNASISTAGRAARLELLGGGMRWAFSRQPLHIELPMLLIVWSAAELLTAAPAGRLKQCAGAACGWVFLDQTRNGRRRWCEMEVCGSRDKMRRLRARRASASPQAASF